MAPLRPDSGDSAFILQVSSCLTPLETIHNASILCRDGRIQAIGGISSLRVLHDIPCVDMSHCHAIPGLIDTHIHGSGGFAAMDADCGGDIDSMSRILAQHGVTSFTPTVLSAPAAKMLSVLNALAAMRERDLPGAAIVGIHLEGPFLSLERGGAQTEEWIRAIDLGEAAELLAAGRGSVTTMTWAPELPRSVELVELLLANGVVPSMGHSNAGSDSPKGGESDVLAAVEAGARHCTHIYNGMPELNQRRTGLTSVALTDDRIVIELISDGVHVHPRMIDLACRSKPAKGVIGISDATQGAGLSDGEYHLGKDKVRIKDGVCRRISDGRLAGSSLTLDRALRNLQQFASLSDNQALSCFTRNAAAGIGLDDRGVIVPGKRADIAVVDNDWNVRMTIVGGRIVYADAP